MGSTLSYGFEKPQTGDKGSSFFPALETDIQKMNDHNHNGTNSAKLTAAAGKSVVQALTAAGWSGSAGVYTRTVTLPAALTTPGGVYDDFAITVRNHADGSTLFLDVVKLSSTTFRLTINDNSLDVDVIYT